MENNRLTRVGASLTLTLMLLVGMMVMAIAPLSAQAQNPAKIGAALQEKLSSAVGELSVIVTFATEGPLTETDVALLDEIGIQNGVLLQSLPMAGVLATSEQIKELVKSEQVLSVYLNRELTYYNSDATALTGVDEVREDDDMRKQNNGVPFTGSGIGIVVNDSGVDGTHEDHKFGENLVENVLGSTNLNAISGLLPITYQEGVANTDTNSGHGTHVAGTVGGTGEKSAGKHEGAAPGASLIGYGSGAALFVLDGIGGFDYALTQQSKFNIRVITNSWGSSGDFDPLDPINIASKAAFDRGITVLFAAGNEGPGENTHNPYAKAPWVISVAAGEKNGTLADFSSRGTKDVGGSFVIDGEEWTWADEPTITAPGVDIISTRVIAPVSSLAATEDVEGIEPAYVPFYTMMSGTSMATPHAAGVVALMLEANPQLSPAEIKTIIQNTATNMPGYEVWEVGAGYLNAYAAVDAALTGDTYGETVNVKRAFNSSVKSSAVYQPFSVDYNPAAFVSDQPYQFEVAEGTAALTAKVFAKGLLEETGNPVNLILIAPDGTEYSSGISLLFPLYTDRTVAIPSPLPGTWQAEIRGLRGTEENPIGVGMPETVEGTLAFKSVTGFSGLADIDGHPAEAAIKLGVNERLFDGLAKGKFLPDRMLTRGELADYLVMGAGVRQAVNNKVDFQDVSADHSAFIEAVTSKGAALKGSYQQEGLMISNNGSFAPKEGVSRADLAYALVQSLGLEKLAAESANEQVTVQYGDTRVVIEDAEHIPASLKGHVQLALDLNMINAYFSVEQGEYDLEPTVHASFKPAEKITRADFAVAMTRFFESYLK